MDKVLTTTEFILWMDANPKKEWEQLPDALAAIQVYAQLMRNHLELGMFTPCVDGKPVEPPVDTDSKYEYVEDEELLWDDDLYQTDKEQYQQAKEQVLFDGWGFNDGYLSDKKLHYNAQTCKNGGVYWMHGFKADATEDLARQIDLKPTQAFLNKIGL